MDVSPDNDKIFVLDCIQVTDYAQTEEEADMGQNKDDNVLIDIHVHLSDNNVVHFQHVGTKTYY